MTLDKDGKLGTKIISLNQTDEPTSGIKDTVQLFTNIHPINTNYSSLFFKIGTESTTQLTSKYMIPGMIVSNVLNDPTEAIPGMFSLYTSGSESSLKICVSINSENLPIWKTVTLT